MLPTWRAMSVKKMGNIVVYELVFANCDEAFIG